VDSLKLNEGRGKRDRVSFHTLRHTAATFAARRGTPVKDLQLLFGWKTPSMVFRYAHGDEAIQRQAVEGVAQALLGEPAKVIPLVRKETRHDR
jgi:integrase